MDLQRDAWLDAGVDPHQLCMDKASGARDDRPYLRQTLVESVSQLLIACWMALPPAYQWMKRMSVVSAPHTGSLINSSETPSTSRCPSCQDKGIGVRYASLL